MHNKQVTSLLFLLHFNWISCLSYESNCSEVFYPELGEIQTLPLSYGFDMFDPCVWKITVNSNDTIRLSIGPDYIFVLYLGRKCLREYIEVHNGDSEHSPELQGSVCKEDKDVTVTTTGPHIWLKYDPTKQVQGAIIHVEIISNRLQYTLHNDNVTWQEAQTLCQNQGGRLARSYPIATATLRSKVTDDEEGQSYWIGKSMSAWVWLRGCVKWIKPTSHEPVYSTSKYNQQAECALACQGAEVFLLQNQSCYCVQKLEVAMETTVYSDCNIRCPGYTVEKCGGENSYTFYQYYTQSLDDDNHGLLNCISARENQFIASNCHDLLGYTCQFQNDTYITFSPQSTLNFGALSWQQAVDHCSSLGGSVGLSPIPHWPQGYVGDEALWTSVSRQIDWNYPTDTLRDPVYSYMVEKTVYSDMTERLVTATELHGFICEHDNTSCVYNMTGSAGVMTLPSMPGLYPANHVCIWYITVKEGLVVHLVPELMDIEDNPSCLYDYIEIRDVGLDTSPQRVCGGEYTGVVIVTRSHEVKVTFYSDDSIQGQGFKLNWEAVVPEDKTGANKARSTAISGGAIAGIVVFLTVVAVIAFLVIFGVLYKKRHQRKMSINYDGQSSSINNAIYGFSSFRDTSVVNDGAAVYENEPKSYENVSQTRKNMDQVYVNNPVIPEESALQDPTINTMAVNGTTTRSTANLVDNEEEADATDEIDGTKTEESETDQKDDKDKRGKVRTEEKDFNMTQTGAAPRNDGESETDTSEMTMADIENIGRDAITVVKRESIPLVAKITPDDTDDHVYTSIKHPVNSTDSKAYEIPVTKGLKVKNNENEYDHPYDNDFEDIINDTSEKQSYENLEHGGTGHNPLVAENSNIYVELDPSSDYRDMGTNNIQPHKQLVPEASNAYAEIGHVDSIRK